MKRISVDKCYIEGLAIIKPRVHGDDRGYFMETYNYNDMKSLGIDRVFVQDNQSKSSKGVLRGLHFQKNYPQGKLIRVIKGSIFDVAVDIRKDSETFGNERVTGESKYPLKKMMSFAFNGITSFSIKPIRMVFNCGIMFFLISAIAAVWAIIEKGMGNTVPGWSSLMVSIWFVGGAVLLGLGIVGEYIGKIYREVKRRPRYIIKDKLL